MLLVLTSDPRRKAKPSDDLMPLAPRRLFPTSPHPSHSLTSSSPLSLLHSHHTSVLLALKRPGSLLPHTFTLSLLSPWRFSQVHAWFAPTPTESLLSLYLLMEDFLEHPVYSWNCRQLSLILVYFSPQHLPSQHILCISLLSVFPHSASSRKAPWGPGFSAVPFMCVSPGLANSVWYRACAP